MLWVCFRQFDCGECLWILLCVVVGRFVGVTRSCGCNEIAWCNKIGLFDVLV